MFALSSPEVEEMKKEMEERVSLYSLSRWFFCLFVSLSRVFVRSFIYYRPSHRSMFACKQALWIFL